MAKRIILAVAGAGKTYHICHAIDPKKRNLILAFTHENVANIQRELIGAFGAIPALTTISTFDSFVYRNLILPYEPSIGAHFNCAQFISKGITTINPPPQRVKSSSGKMIPNRRYVAKNKLLHYIDSGLRYYCATLSELALQVKCEGVALIGRAAKRLNLFYDKVCIDEFQDFREYDYDLIVKLSKALNDVTLVGDYYQHSVSGTNNSGKPFSKRKSIVPYSDFLNLLQDKKLIVDTDSLNVSRRCSSKICDFVRERLKIDIYGNAQKSGDIIIINDMELAQRVIKNNNITKLVYNKADKMPFNAVNWSYSKGDTLNESCVMLTNATDIILDVSKSCKEISPITLNKLYVALTRSSGDTYLISSSLSKKIICDISKK